MSINLQLCAYDDKKRKVGEFSLVQIPSNIKDTILDSSDKYKTYCEYIRSNKYYKQYYIEENLNQLTDTEFNLVEKYMEHHVLSWYKENIEEMRQLARQRIKFSETYINNLNE